jgi:hypothetical protein
VTSYRREIGSRWRRLAPGRQALLVLAHLSCGDTYAQLAAGFGIGIATAYRYITEALGLLADLAPTLAEAVRMASTKAFALLDGTLLPARKTARTGPGTSTTFASKSASVTLMTVPLMGMLLRME